MDLLSPRPRPFPNLSSGLYTTAGSSLDPGRNPRLGYLLLPSNMTPWTFPGRGRQGRRLDARESRCLRQLTIPTKNLPGMFTADLPQLGLTSPWKGNNLTPRSTLDIVPLQLRGGRLNPLSAPRLDQDAPIAPLPMPWHILPVSKESHQGAGSVARCHVTSAMKELPIPFRKTQRSLCNTSTSRPCATTI